MLTNDMKEIHGSPVLMNSSH